MLKRLKRPEIPAWDATGEDWDYYSAELGAYTEELNRRTMFNAKVAIGLSALAFALSIARLLGYL